MVGSRAIQLPPNLPHRIAALVAHLKTNGAMHQETRTFGTMTRGILKTADWLAAEGLPLWRWNLQEFLGSQFTAF